MFMENSPNNPDAPVTSAVLNAVLKAEFGKFEEPLDKKLDRLLSDQANVILEAVGKTMEKKLNDKFDPVITKLDCDRTDGESVPKLVLDSAHEDS